MSRAGRNGRGRRGHTIVELGVAGAMMCVLTVGALAALATGGEVQRFTIAEQTATRMATRLAGELALDLMDAPGASVVAAPGDPGALTYRKIVGYDPAAASPDDRRIETGTIAIRTRPLDAQGAPPLLAVERVHPDGRIETLAGYVAQADLEDPGLPGLHFDVARIAGRTCVVVTVNVAVPGGRDGPVRARLSRLVRMEVE